MRLNLKFKDRANHAWLHTEDATELFIRRPLESFLTMGGSLVCRVPSSQMDEIRDDGPAVPSSTFVCCTALNETKVYSVIEAVTYQGGDCLLFIKPLATFH